MSHIIGSQPQDPSPVPEGLVEVTTVGQLRAALARFDHLPDDVPLRATYDYLDRVAEGRLLVGRHSGEAELTVDVCP